MSLILILFMFGILFTATSTRANECDGLLAPDMGIMISDDTLRLAYLNQLTRTEWMDQRKTLSSGASFLINAIPVTADLDYDEMKKRVTSEMSRREFKLDARSSRWYYASRINPQNAERFVECINSGGLKIYPAELFGMDKNFDEIVAIRVRWQAPDPELQRAAKLDYSKSRNIKDTKDLPNVIKSSGSIVFPIERVNLKEPMYLLINSGGTHAATYISIPTPELKPVTKADPQPPSMADFIIASSDHNRKPCIVHLKQGVGSLPAGEDMSLRFYANQNLFVLTRHPKFKLGGNIIKARDIAHGYSNANLGHKTLTLWGAQYTFDESGNLNRPNSTGTITCPPMK